MEINEALKRFRKEKNLKQEDVAKCLGIHQQAYSRYENENKMKSDQIVKICKYYHVSADYLLGLSDEP